MSGGACPNPLPSLSAAAAEVLTLLRVCEKQTRAGFDGPYSFDYGTVRAIALDLGLDTTGTHELSDGALFWTRFTTLADEYFRIVSEAVEARKFAAGAGPGG
jgi:hypothetical protein